MGHGIKLFLLSTWATVFVIGQTGITVAAGSLYYSQNGSKWPDDGHVTETIALVGIISGSITAAIAISCWAFDKGQYPAVVTPGMHVMRMLFELSILVASYCMISIAAIYLYVHHSKDGDTAKKGMWSPVNGTSNATSTSLVSTADVATMSYVYLGMVIFNGLIATAHLNYLLLRSAYPCRSANPGSRRDSLGNLVRGKSAYELHMEKLVDLLPFFGSIGGGHGMQVDGVPMTLLIQGQFEPDQRRMYKDAAETLVGKLKGLYDLESRPV